MAGTRAGAAKAMKTLRERHGDDFHRRIGAIGGSRVGTDGGFAAKTPCDCDIIPTPHKHQQCAGVKGGRISRRGSRNGTAATN